MSNCLNLVLPVWYPGWLEGVDQLGILYATQYLKPVAPYPADWATYGKSAGYRRNIQMAENADALIAITNGSLGTAHMIDIASKKGLKMFVHYTKTGLWIRQ